MKKEWQTIQRYNPSILLCHAREASKGVGPPEINSNNHPFVTDDLKIGLVHNGRIPDDIYFSLKNHYETRTECDSELFLRMFDLRDIELDEISIEERVESIKDIWQKTISSHFVVAIGESLASQSRLWIFRNEHRSLYKIDCTEELGQIFFVSTKEIWQDSNVFSINHKIEEVQTEKIHCFSLVDDGMDHLIFDI